MNSVGRERGVSLIEALVAVAVLAFGVLGIAGMQMNLRQNSDVSKQRSEAVRIAQATVESARDYWLVNTDTTVCASCAFADIVSASATDVTPTVGNTTYSLTITASAPDFTDPAVPRLKDLQVSVNWNDRSGQAQGPVVLTTKIARVPPQLAGTLSVPTATAATHAPGGRNSAIPSAAVDQGDGTSVFTPPGGGGVTWTFDNVTGFIIKVCGSDGTCNSTTLFLLAGYVRFATLSPMTAPTSTDSETPPGPPTSPPAPASVTIAGVTGVEVDLTIPAATTVICFTQPTSAYVAYYCAVPTSGATPTWSGRSLVDATALANSLSDSGNALIKVCRYTPVMGDTPTDSSGALDNTAHPLDYAGVTGSLTNQNFLVIRAGNGFTPFACPGDNSATPFVNGNTWRHQPVS